MPIRIANRTTLRHALVLAVLLACVAGNSRSGSSQRKPVAPRPVATSITITGETRLYNPGDTSQLTMIATFSDGTTRDVTAEAGWGHSGGITISKGGLITALTYGDFEVFHNNFWWLEPLRIPICVMPEGSFMVTVHVTEGGGFWLDGAQVSGISAFGTMTATSGSWYYGTCILAPVSGEAVVRVEKDGFVAQEKQLTVERDEVVDFELQRIITSPDSIDGVYTMTFTAAPGCALPPDFIQRKYLARITESANGWLSVELDGPGFIEPCWWFYNGFTGKREGSSVRFDLVGDPNTLSEYIFNEAVDGFCPCLNGLWWGSCSDRYLDYTGTAAGMIVDGNISAVFSGYVLLYGAQSAQCAGDHRLDFARVVPTPNIVK